MPRYRLTRVRKQQSSKVRTPALDVYPYGVIPEEALPPISRDVLQAVLAQCEGDLQRAIDALLEM
jgi:hypothetical protein